MKFLVASILLGVFKGTSAGDIDLGAIEDNFHKALINIGDHKSGVQCDEISKGTQCPLNQVTFWLYTQEHKTDPYQFDAANDASIRDAFFVRDAPIKVLVHGYTMNKDKAINEVLRPAYLDHDYNYNIISVDWSELCKSHCYVKGANSIPAVGNCVAEFLKKVKDVRTDLGEIHILGHSMGAHVVAWASQNIDVPRITQFDPALPLFSDSDSLFTWPRATTVDVWHSNSGLKGRKDSSGTTNLYFNDEMNQPGCGCSTSCSHLQAVKYYAETITERKTIKAFRCRGFSEYDKGECPKPGSEDDLGDFGENIGSVSLGDYLTFTNPQFPYIIDGSDFTNQQKFDNFKNTHDPSCPSHDFFKILGEVLIGG